MSYLNHLSCKYGVYRPAQSACTDDCIGERANPSEQLGRYLVSMVANSTRAYNVLTYIYCSG